MLVDDLHLDCGKLFGLGEAPCREDSDPEGWPCSCALAEGHVGDHRCRCGFEWADYAATHTDTLRDGI